MSAEPTALAPSILARMHGARPEHVSVHRAGDSAVTVEIGERYHFGQVELIGHPDELRAVIMRAALGLLRLGLPAELTDDEHAVGHLLTYGTEPPPSSPPPPRREVNP